jgi:transcriptional regulator with XRE-family HTH domain
MSTLSASDFAALLRDELQARGISRKDFAGTVRVSRNTVTSWTRGRYRPDHEHGERIAAALGMSIDELHGRAMRQPSAGRVAAASRRLPRADREAERIVRQLAALELDRSLEAIRRATPDLLRVLADARDFAPRGKGAVR